MQFELIIGILESPLAVSQTGDDEIDIVELALKTVLMVNKKNGAGVMESIKSIGEKWKYTVQVSDLPILQTII
jgi:hypothetical protein